MDGPLAPRRSRLDQAIETAAALLAILLYVTWVSRGELLPYAGAARSLTAPLLALAVAGLAGWRLRRPLVAAWRAGLVQRWAVAGAGLALAAGLRIVLGGFGRPLEPAEAAALSGALQIIRNLPIETTEPAPLALAWLHAPVAAFVYVNGVSAGLWEGIKYVAPGDVAPWSRGVHLGLSLAGVAAAGAAAGRRAGWAAGGLAAGLLAVSGAGVTAAVTVDAGAPAGLLVALALLAAAQWRPTRRTLSRQRGAGGWAGRWRRPARAGAALLGLAALGLPGVAGAALAPVAAFAAALAAAPFLPVPGKPNGDPR
jgi:hypothetical protein